ncbi:VanZ family protein [Blastococcus saxobsidens]|uniref:VanZ family protein n=1 Tax=Blastococcus saxobsidens TaxID=138336 RepID=A0A6L9W513_9ACTN|nr:VanZ family protein [Blastococcus saxobsidens]NEK86902.1 VanZ family protein [Blastococcus saxobsidens]
MPSLAFGLTVLVSVVVLFIPASGVPTAPPGTDKVVHLLLFAALAATGRWAGLARWPLAAGLTGYALLSEVVQGVAPLGRSGSVADLVADVLGIAMGLAAWAWTAGRSR